MAVLLRGRFFEFHAERVTSRAGQPIQTRVGIEIGPEISREDALRQLKAGKDVYTLGKEEAYKLAGSAHAGRPIQDVPHGEYYYQHFHPGGVHPVLDRNRPGPHRAALGPGHVFFGERGENRQLAG